MKKDERYFIIVFLFQAPVGLGFGVKLYPNQPKSKTCLSVTRKKDSETRIHNLGYSKVFKAPRDIVSVISSTNLMCSALSEASDPLRIMGVRSQSCAPL